MMGSSIKWRPQNEALFGRKKERFAFLLSFQVRFLWPESDKIRSQYSHSYVNDMCVFVWVECVAFDLHAFLQSENHCFKLSFLFFQTSQPKSFPFRPGGSRRLQTKAPSSLKVLLPDVAHAHSGWVERLQVSLMCKVSSIQLVTIANANTDFIVEFD